MQTASRGRWRLTHPTDTDGARGVRFCVGNEQTLVLFDGLYDGERIAGTVYDIPDRTTNLVDEQTLNHLLHGEANPMSIELGDFLCTRLFTFWGTPKPKAAEFSNS